MYLRLYYKHHYVKCLIHPCFYLMYVTPIKNMVIVK